MRDPSHQRYKIINPECSVHVRLHQPTLFITQTPTHRAVSSRFTTLAPRPRRVARFIQSLAKSSVSLGDEPVPNEPKLLALSFSLPRRLAIARVETLWTNPEPHNATHVVFHATPKHKQTDSFAVQRQETNLPLLEDHNRKFLALDLRCHSCAPNMPNQVPILSQCPHAICSVFQSEGHQHTLHASTVLRASSLECNVSTSQANLPRVQLHSDPLQLSAL